MAFPSRTAQASLTRFSIRIRHSEILNQESDFPGIRSRQGRPRSAPDSECLTSCQCRSCLASMPCKPSPSGAEVDLTNDSSCPRTQ